ncbi:type I methionyl aminopeptidase [Campylobacter canadensis]|uniref:Methionine aminopeptidase n=1 Tax=Campylobacter canadensis TaxID=449520 RepID=A0ABS7WU14_9BACT|nr:type I methionyl aminopeptidase [Campylobacter canadensis]MBZ7987414.1 type I methionyl aminopeptidase [Campylobacter canadensis]MBZ7998609.1 type I methionyl aminopeptidase [Campylobacter canadensis]
MIDIYKLEQIEKIRKANELVAKTLDFLEQNTKAGMSLKQVDKMAEEFILSHNAKCAFKGLYGFPGAICLSLNQTCIHGIPDDRILKEGDILGCDVGTIIDGYYGDAARTFGIGKISKKDEELISCAKGALLNAIDNIKEGMRFKELSKILQDYITKAGFTPLLGFCGHGIGKKPHAEPEIPNYLSAGDNAKGGPKIKNGMVFCIEPMICQKDGRPKNVRGDWETQCYDGLNTAHYEHCVAIINNKAEILSI